MTTHGVMRAIGNPGPGYPSDAPWVDRARRAHINAIENLAVFAPLVLVGAMIDVSTKATVLSAQIYVVARLAHYVIYAAGIPVLRTLAFAQPSLSRFRSFSPRTKPPLPIRHSPLGIFCDLISLSVRQSILIPAIRGSLKFRRHFRSWHETDMPMQLLHVRYRGERT
jgi:uncharacterized MAPEG superfamily protein